MENDTAFLLIVMGLLVGGIFGRTVLPLETVSIVTKFCTLHNITYEDCARSQYISCRAGEPCKTMYRISWCNNLSKQGVLGCFTMDSVEITADVDVSKEIDGHFFIPSCNETFMTVCREDMPNNYFVSNKSETVRKDKINLWFN